MVPPRVEYTLTELGESFVPILMSMRNWGEENLLKGTSKNPCEKQKRQGTPDTRKAGEGGLAPVETD